MADRVELAFRRAAERLLPRAEPLLVAVSGGGDSVALLHLLQRNAVARRQPLVVAHLDHAMRRGSGADRRFVEGLACDLGRPCASDRRDVTVLRRAGESPEEAARRVRRAFLLEAATQHGCALVVTGHTLDDQAETILMRLVRGAGPTALAGMSERGPGPFVRPLLGLEREDLRTWLRRRKIDFRDDPTNRDLRFDRNRVRRLVLPELARTLNPRAARGLVRAAARFREDAEHLDAEAAACYEACAHEDHRGRVTLEVESVRALPPVLARRVARLALRRAGADMRRVGSRHVDALLDLARGGRGRSADLPGRLGARRVSTRLILGPRSAQTAE